MAKTYFDAPPNPELRSSSTIFLKPLFLKINTILFERHKKNRKRNMDVCWNKPRYDHVFESDYNRTLSELEQYIKQNKRLPEIPSAQEIEENGVNLGDMQGKQQLK